MRVPLLPLAIPFARRSSRSVLLSLGILLLWASPNAAALDWASEHLKLSTTTADEEVVGVFEYTNKSQRPVRILEVKTGCDCARPDFPQTEIMPGQSGLLRIVFRVGGRTGLQQRHLEVLTNEEGDSLRRLDFEVEILELLEVRPRLAFWKKDLAAEPRIVRLRLPLPGKTRILSVKSDSSAFACEWLVDDEAKGLHHISIRPAETGKILQGQVLVTYEHEGKALQTLLFLAVR